MSRFPLSTVVFLTRMISRWWILILYLAVYFWAINAVTLHRFWQFEVFYYDHSIFDQALWRAAHFKAPTVDHLGYAPFNQLGDHFTPLMYVLAPLYWFTSSYEALFVMSNFFVVLSALVLAHIAARRLRSRFLVFVIVFSYTLFVGLQNAVIAGFHTELPALLTLSLLLLSIERKRWGWYVFFLLVTLGLKESFAIIGVGIGIFLFLRGKRQWGIFTLTFSVCYYFLATKAAIPLISGQAYGYTQAPLTTEGLLVRFFYPWVKTKTMLFSLLTFGLLPLAAFSLLPALSLDYFARFVLADSPARVDLGLHYNALVSVLLAYGAILGFAYLLRRYRWYRRVVILHGVAMLLFVLSFHRFFYHGPLGLFYNRDFYAHTSNFAFMRTFLDIIPNQGLVMTFNNIAPHLTHSHNVMLLRPYYWLWRPDVIALDLRPGQNPNNFWPLPENQLLDMYEGLVNDPCYEQMYAHLDQVVFVRKSCENLGKTSNTRVIRAPTTETTRPVLTL